MKFQNIIKNKMKFKKDIMKQKNKINKLQKIDKIHKMNVNKDIKK